MSNSVTAKFAPGDLVEHNLFDYRGVVIDIDPHFLGSPEWYNNVAKSHPPKDRPWYHVLVDGGDVQTLPIRFTPTPTRARMGANRI